MSESIERLAINSWRTATISGQWSEIGWQFFGIYRLALWENDEPAAELADFLSSLASYRMAVTS